MLPRRTVAAFAAAGLLLPLSACGSGFDDSSQPATQQAGPATLKVMIAASGGAELKAMQDAAAAWSTASGGSKAEVVSANDLAQQLSQGFAAGSPPDVFAVDATKFQGYAAEMLPYGDGLSYKDDIYPTLRTTFTQGGKLYCAPKDFSTLALAINTDDWAAAGLTDADFPKTWTSSRPWRRSSPPAAAPGSSSTTPATGSAPSWCRPAAGWSTPTRRRPPRTPRRTSRP